MAILGTLLVSMLVAMSRMTKQSAMAERRMEACRIMDDMMQVWWEDIDNFPRDDVGEVPDEPGWTWQVSGVASEAADALGAAKIAIEIFSPQEPTVAACKLELLMPVLEEEPETPPAEEPADGAAADAGKAGEAGKASGADKSPNAIKAAAVNQAGAAAIKAAASRQEND